MALTVAAVEALTKFSPSEVHMEPMPHEILVLFVLKLLPNNAVILRILSCGMTAFFGEVLETNKCQLS